MFLLYCCDYLETGKNNWELREALGSGARCEARPKWLWAAQGAKRADSEKRTEKLEAEVQSEVFELIL